VREQFFHSNIPIVSGNQFYLERPQIFHLFEEALKRQVILVIAGAGYGKTHSVYSFLHSSPYTATWLQLSERDNLGWRFWENFTQAISLHNKAAADKLTKLGFPETEGQFERYLALRHERLAQGVKHVLVFDDFHLIHEKSVRRFVERSINIPYTNISAILISRNEPAVNTMNLLSKGLLFKITEENLRFSQDEIDRYFQKQEIKLSKEILADICHDTEGWAFAIHLLGLALKNNPAGAGYARSSMRYNIFKLIEGEIFSIISPGLQKYLIKLSLIDRLPLELLNELAAPEETGTDLLKEMENIDTFVRFDSYLNVFHIHHLFLEYLSEKTNLLTEEEKQDVYMRAARWCAANNQKMDAISYYEKAGAYDKVIEVVYTLNLALPDNIAKFLLDILDRAPREMYAENSAAYILHGRLLFILGRIEEAEAEAKELIRMFKPLPLTPYTSRVLYGSHVNLGFISMFTGMRTSRYDFASYFERARHYYPLNPLEVQGPITVISLGSYACWVGSPDKEAMERYLEALTTAVPHISEVMNGCTYGMDDLARTEVAYFKGNMDKAEKLAYQALYKARERNQYEIENRAIFYLLRLSIARGDNGAIQELFALLEAQLELPEYVNRYTFYDIVTGWFYAQTRQTEKIAPWLRSDFEESELNSLMYGLEILVRIKWNISEKRYPAALASMENPKTIFSLGALIFGKIALKALEAVCLYHLDEKKGALRALEAAYGLSESNALDMPFIELGKDMRTLAGIALKDKDCHIPRPWLENIRCSSSAYAKKLFAVMEQYRDRTQGPQDGTAELSSREMEILIGLSRGLTREELAEDGDISINTVKSVIKSVYIKLDAVNRADAVRIATAMGILEGDKG
jgi:LuxR family maltose regulon positive regulatory protein